MLDALEAHPLRRPSGSEGFGEGGIRTHVPIAGQDAFEAPPLRPLRYLSAGVTTSKRTFYYSLQRRGTLDTEAAMAKVQIRYCKV